MNLFINTFITPKSLGNGYFRGQLPPEDNKVDVFRFMLNSMAAGEIFNKVYIYCKLDEHYKGQQADLEETVYSLFGDSVLLFWHRNEAQTEWQDAISAVLADGDENTFLSTNHDHIFTGTKDVMYSIDTELSKKEDIRCRQVYASHWGQLTSWAYFNTHKTYDNFTSFLQPSKDGIQFFNKEALHRLFFENTYGHSFGRIDGLPESSNEPIEILVPIKECMRHYEGYNALGVYPAMTVHPSKVVKYGFDETFPDCVNMNSLKPYRDVDPGNGTDYTNCLEDMPELFKDYHIDIMDGVELEKFKYGRIDAIKRILYYDLNKMRSENGFAKPVENEFVEMVANAPFN